MILKKRAIFRLPTISEFDFLIRTFTRNWDNNQKKLCFVSDVTIDFPANGISKGGKIYNDGYENFYWCTNTEHTPSCFHFHASAFVSTGICAGLYYSRSVRLVSDFPFEGGIEINGVWWKPYDEPGFYTFEEALKRYDKIEKSKKVKH